MYRNKLLWCLFVLAAIAAAWGFKQAGQDIGVENTLAIFREGAADFASASLELEKCVRGIDSRQPASIDSAKAALRRCRLQYKRIEFFLDYFFYSSSLAFNRPAKTEIEEPYMEYDAPVGLQQIAVLLFDEEPFSQKQALLEQATVVSSTATDLASLLYGFNTTDKAILESVRLELVRLYAKGITGFDAPELKSSIPETAQSLQTLRDVLQPWLRISSPESKMVSNLLNQCIIYLQQHPDFDSFDRLTFLSEYALPLQTGLGQLIRTLHLEQHTRSALNYDAPHLFSNNALNPAAFADGVVVTPALKKLGKRLFFEKALSGNNNRNCATCHQPEKYFSDGLRTSLALDEKHYVRRNAPSLYYAGFQYAQFWDGRAGNLHKQILEVISNPEEMNGIHAVVIRQLKDSSTYQLAFREAFPEDTNAISMPHLATAIAAWLRTLAPMNSPLDAYFAGNKNALTPAQKRGFNLFMGKAQCGTCHFAPLFNGLTPPLYQFTEFENLGVPLHNNLRAPVPDTDPGRFGFFPVKYYQRAFKTPTVRNAAVTAPYMHNGIFSDLETVMKFYNEGGGNGLGLKDPYQTLSPAKLHLTDEEIREVVDFMRGLTDRNEE
jgi:cytochrome c peroxidase